MIVEYLKIIGIVLVTGLLTVSSCIYPFDPPSEEYQDLLVVEAVLSDGDEDFLVKLSRSIPVDTSGIQPERYAQVSLSDDMGNIYDLYEAGPGQYLTYDLAAVAGRTYQLYIQTSDGNQYMSEPVNLRTTPPVDSVFYRYDERVTTEGDKLVPGLQIYVTTHDANNNTWYYRWEFEETWEFRTRYNSTLKWENGMLLERDEQIHQCWKNNRSKGILAASSKSLSEDVIYEFPVTYVSNATDRLNYKYSILVKQYSLSEESFSYWKDLEKLNENLGTLFDPQPYMLEGNIHNVHDDNEIVLGYFDASSLREERIFIERGEFTYFPAPDYYEFCTDTVGGYGLIPEFIRQGFMLVGRDITRPGSYLFSSPGCVDCTIAGTNKEPDFWE